MICVYCLSFAPALLYLEIHRHRFNSRIRTASGAAVEHAKNPARRNGARMPEASQIRRAQPRSEVVRRHANYRLLFFFIFLVQMGDALQYIWGKLAGRRMLVPTISPNRTWEGFLGGVAARRCSARRCGGSSRRFARGKPPAWRCLVSVLGFFGGLTMSAIKRDRGVKDYGTLVEGHGGVLDRIDSICFAAPVFYHITWLMFPPG